MMIDTMMDTALLTPQARFEELGLRGRWFRAQLLVSIMGWTLRRLLPGSSIHHVRDC